MTFPNVTIPNSEVRQLVSSFTGRSYDIYLHLPNEYAKNLERKYSALYVLDGQWDFKLMDSLCGGLVFDEFMPEAIIVGISYTGANPDYGALRAMDYTPIPDEDFPGSGDGSKFFTFFKEELLPFIESNYRTDSSRRVLIGSSFGGTFTLYGMFSDPNLFHGYIASSPAVPYADNFAFKQEAEFAYNRQDLPVRLFVSVGELEELAQPVQEFIQILSERNYPGLEMQTRIIKGERHAGSKAEAYNRGLRFIFHDE